MWRKLELTQEQLVRRRILRYATSLHNACKKSYEGNKCKGCPFEVEAGCNLYGYPIEWGDKLNKVK